jgi:hypothetical protein
MGYELGSRQSEPAIVVYKHVLHDQLLAFVAYVLETSDVGRVFLVLLELVFHGVEVDLSLPIGGYWGGA